MKKKFWYVLNYVIYHLFLFYYVMFCIIFWMWSIICYLLTYINRFLSISPPFIFIKYCFTFLNFIWTMPHYIDILIIINNIWMFIEKKILKMFDVFSNFIKQYGIFGVNEVDTLEQLFLSLTLLFLFYFICWFCILFIWLLNYFWTKYIKKNILIGILLSRRLYLSLYKKKELLLLKTRESLQKKFNFWFEKLVIACAKYWITDLFLECVVILVDWLINICSIVYVILIKYVFFWIFRVGWRYPISTLLIFSCMFLFFVQFYLWWILLQSIFINNSIFKPFFLFCFMFLDRYIIRISCFYWLLFDHNLHWLWSILLIFV